MPMSHEQDSTERVLTANSAALFRALSDPGRLALLRHLLLSEHNVRELTEHLGLAQSTVSGHLACLRDCGLVTSRAVGRSSSYAVTEPALVTSLLDVAEQLLEATDDQVTVCPTATGHGRHVCRTRGSCRICPHTSAVRT
jgi:ArsR family transcriptional regulator, cadmium/lead-responsive transcriptional repressor